MPAPSFGAFGYREVVDGVIEIEGLRKEYRKLRKPPTVALAGLDLVVPQGGVFGFLGPNGSGKTTTIRCLLGLVRPSGGRARVLGKDALAELPQVIHRVGSIVETPLLFPRFSARRNLELLARMYSIEPQKITDALHTVGLAERAKDKVRTYSLGMRQRLAIAAALLKDPDLLILDEPANGLDPAGIKEVRELLRRLGAEGKTVFVSSHILAEIAQTCDRVAILSHGRCVAAGSVDDILSGARAGAVLVRVPDEEPALTALRAAGLEATAADGFLRVTVPPQDAGRVTQILAGSGIYLTELRPEAPDLETVFLQLTQNPATPAPPTPPPAAS